MIENIRLSLQGIWGHKMRSFLTMLGIIIGIASIISIISTIKGTNEQIKNNLIGSGDNTVKVRLEMTENDGMDMYYDDQSAQTYDGVPMVDESVLEQIRAIDNLESVSKYRLREYTWNEAFYNDRGLEGSILGIDADYFQTAGYVFKKGRNFRAEEFSKYQKIAVIDDDAVNYLMSGEDPIGKNLDIKGETYVVVGVVAKAVKFEPVIHTEEDYWMYHDYESTGKIFIPESTWPIVYQYDEPEHVIVKAKTTDDMKEVSKEAAKILNAGISEESNYKYKAENFLQQAEQIQEMGKAANTQLLWIASISLLVGGIGVMNIMLVSVTERTREIGLKKAIGARRRKIMTQFLTEAAVLTSIGGIIGVLAGIGMSHVISRVAEIPVAISIPSILLGVVFSTCIGILFGLLPSFKAASLNPIDALRYE